MLRACFFAFGLFVSMCGGAFLAADEIVLTSKYEEEKPKPERPEEFRGLFMTANKDRQKVFNPPEWAAFTLMSVGTVTMLYAVALPKRQPM